MTYSKPAILITGGAQRLGLATAIALQEDGHRVVITYRRERSQLARLRQRGIETLQADFTDHASIESFCDRIIDRFDLLRAIIHNASEWLPEGGEVEDSEILQRMLNVHVAAPYLINRRCAKLLTQYGQACGQADILHLSDYVATCGSHRHIAYAASKAALDNLTLSFASALAPLVKVNSIAPSLLMFNQDDAPDYRERALRKSLLHIAPGESEGVEAIRYILNSRYLTGKTIALDGGRHLARAG